MSQRYDVHFPQTYMYYTESNCRVDYKLKSDNERQYWILHKRKLRVI